jgi:serine/threonine-protein kinase SRPK3
VPWLHGQLTVLLPAWLTPYLTQTFELLTGFVLFDPKGGQAWRTEDGHLAKMMGVTGESFSQTMLSASRKREEYFDKDG